MAVCANLQLCFFFLPSFYAPALLNPSPPLNCFPFTHPPCLWKVTKKIRELMADHESMNGLHESHDLFKREHDEQLVQWMNRRPDDWTLSAGGSGTIYGWGHNHRGQLGGIEGAKVKVPTPTEALATLRPVQLIGGEQTLFAVTADGKVATQRSYIANKGVDQKCFSCDFEHCLVFCFFPLTFSFMPLGTELEADWALEERSLCPPRLCWSPSSTSSSGKWP